MKNLVQLLNQEVANLGVLYTKLHHFHWFVEGRQFHQLHEFFENLYDEVTEHFDAVAERILMLEEAPVSTLKGFLELATVKEATTVGTAEEMLKETLSDLQLLDTEFTTALEAAQELADEVTVDLLLGMKASFQKTIWMIKATLK